MLNRLKTTVCTDIQKLTRPQAKQKAFLQDILNTNKLII